MQANKAKIESFSKKVVIDNMYDVPGIKCSDHSCGHLARQIVATRYNNLAKGHAFLLPHIKKNLAF